MSLPEIPLRDGVPARTRAELPKGTNLFTTTRVLTFVHCVGRVGPRPTSKTGT